MFYGVTKHSPFLRGPTYTAAEKGDAAGARIGAFAAETVAVLPHLIVGFDGARENTTSLTPSAGAWGMVNGGIGRTMRGLGWLAGMTGGVLTSPVGVAVGFDFKSWVAGASQMGAAVGSLLAKVPVDVSEIARSACNSLLYVAIHSVKLVGASVGGAAGGVIDFATGPPAAMRRLAPASLAQC